MNKSVIKKDEPVDREASGILQGQGFVAALTHQTSRWFTKRVLRGQ